jgi:hypothetical protein
MPIRDTELLEAPHATAEEPSADSASRALLLALVRQPGNAESQNVSGLVAKVRDWDSFLYLAGEHRVSPMVYSRLRECGVALPRAVEARLRAEFERNALQCLINAAELIALLGSLNREMIPAMPYKGIVLAASAYGDLSARPAGDLDLLVYQQHLAQTSEVLFARGFTRLTPVDANGTPTIENLHEYQFERLADGLQLELRWTLDLGHPAFTRHLGLEWMWPNRRTVRLAGADVPDLSPEIALLVLCMHGSKHVWSRLVWICDVAQLLASSPDLDWNKVIREAGKSGLSRTLALGVILAHEIIGAAVPEGLLRRFQSDRWMSALAQHIQETLFDSPSSLPGNRVPYKVRLLEFRDRFRYLFSLNMLRPNDKDRAALPLPKSLHALHYLIRPFRILRDRSAR